MSCVLDRDQFSETFSKQSSAHQYRVCPPLKSIHAWQRRRIDVTSVLKNACGIPFQILTRAHDKSGNVNGWFWRPRNRRCISSHTCSIGDKSGDIAVQGSTFTLFWVKKSVTTRTTCGLALSCCSVALRCCTNGRTWGRMISSRYLMPVSVPSATTSAVLPRDEMPTHTMTLPPPNKHRSITQLWWKRSPTRRYTLERPSLLSRWNLDSSVKRIRAQSCCVCMCMCLLHHPNRATRWRCCRTGRRGRMPCSRNRSRTVRGLILLRPGVLLAAKEAVLSRSRRWTTRVYVSWRIDVTRGRPDRGRSLVAPNCWYRLHKASTVFLWTPNCVTTSVWRTQFHSTLAWRINDVFSKLSWFFVLHVTTLCFNTGLGDKRLCNWLLHEKNLNKKTLAWQANYPCNSGTGQCK